MFYESERSSKLFEYILAQKIKGLRIKQNLTIEEVAKRTSLSKGSISNIENNKSSPPLATLMRISRALGVDISYFFHKPREETLLSIVKKDERDSVIRERAQKRYIYEALAAKNKDEPAKFFVITVHPENHFEGSNLDQHEGEDFVFLLEGRMNFVYGDKTYLIEAGDSLHYDARIPHGIELIENKPAKYLQSVIS